MKDIGSMLGVSTVLTALMIVVGCGDPAKPASKSGGKAGTTANKEGHDQHGTGPHGGTVADWGGGKFHVEFTVDHGKQEATVYVLDSDEKTPAPIKSKDGQLLLTITEPAFQVILQADPQKGDSQGRASRFVGKHEKLGEEQEFAGTISGEVDGTPYAGDFKEEPAPPPQPKK